MLLSLYHKRKYWNRKIAVAAAICYFILCVDDTSALARVDNNWLYRRANTTVVQNHGSQLGYQTANVHNRNNQNLGQRQWHSINNSSTTQYQQANPTLPIRPNQTNYARNPLPVQRAFNQTNTVWSQQPTYPAFNQSRPIWSQPSVPKLPIQGQSHFNQSRPAGSPSLPFYTPQNPVYGHVVYNQSRPSQPSAPAYNQVGFNQTRPTWPQPSAPLLPNNNPQNPISNLYPSLPNNFNNKPAAAPNSWTPAANQTHLYPQLPNQNKSQPPSAGNNNAISLVPLQPQTNQQGSQNWHSGSQSALSYGPGYYAPLPTANNSNKGTTNRQGSSNPYANMFI